MIIRRLGLDESSSRKGSSRGDGPGNSRRRRSSRCTRKDSIRRNRAQSHILQTHVREILLRGTRRHRSLHESRHAEAASAKTASMATTAATASGRHSRLNQADCRKYEQGYKRFRIMLPSWGRSRSRDQTHFLRRNYSAIEGRSRSTNCEPRPIDHHPDAAAKDSKAEPPGLIAESVDMKPRLFKN